MNFLIEPGNRAEFNYEIAEMEDDELWTVLAFYLPTLVFEVSLTCGHA